MGLMLETTSERLAERGGPHFGSPDKLPAVRLATLEAAGAAGVPFTTGILIGIGETREERIDALLAIADSHRRHGHVQEVIVQNFRAKPGTQMADAPEPSVEEHLWTIAAARLLLPPEVHLQAPPNLTEDFAVLLDAGIDDWGGVSPVTIDHVNPEAPWPEVERLREATASRGLELAPRLPVYPEWLAPALARRGGAARRAAARRLARARARGRLGAGRPGRGAVRAAVARCRSTRATSWTRTRSSRSSRRAATSASASSPPPTGCGARSAATRSATSSPGTSSTRTSATSAAASAPSPRASSRRTCAAPAYLVPHEEIVRRVVEAWERGATEVCLQGGIHPGFTGDYYESVVRVIKEAVPGMHVHAFSALEIWQGAATLGLDLRDYLARLQEAGLGSLPGTAAEMLDDEVRAILCPDKVTTAQWLEVHDAAHAVGLSSNNTIMFGHVDGPRNWARHLVAVREQQRAERPLHRVRAAPVRADGGADLPEGPRAPRADVRRGAADARRRPDRAAPVDRRTSRRRGSSSARAAWRRCCGPASTTSAAR